MVDFKESEFKSEEQDDQLPANTRAIASDIAQASDGRDGLDRAPLGSPSADFDVRSIYESRPINSYDFNLSINNDTCAGGLGIWTGNQCDFTFQVPSGYVAILKEVHHSFRTPPVVTSRADVRGVFIINGASYQRGVTIGGINGVPAAANSDPQNIPIGIESDDILQSFVVADENQTIGVRITVSNTVAAVAPICFVHLYGQLLLKSGRPAQFEQANKVGGSGMASGVYTPPTLRQIEAAQSAPQQMVERVVERVAEKPMYRRVQQQPVEQPQQQQVQPMRQHAKGSGGGGRTPIIDRNTGRILGYR